MIPERVVFFLQKIQEMNQFIRENFRQKECQYFVPKKEQKPPAKYIQDLKLVVITSSNFTNNFFTISIKLPACSDT